MVLFMKILILNTYEEGTNEGRMKDERRTMYEEGTNTARGCGTTLNGEFWYFGAGGGSGSPSRRQVYLNEKLCQIRSQFIMAKVVILLKILEHV